MTLDTVIRCITMAVRDGNDVIEADLNPVDFEALCEELGPKAIYDGASLTLVSLTGPVQVKSDESVETGAVRLSCE